MWGGSCLLGAAVLLWRSAVVWGHICRHEDSRHWLLSSWAVKGCRELGWRARCEAGWRSDSSLQGGEAEVSGLQTTRETMCESWSHCAPEWVVAQMGSSQDQTARKGAEAGLEPRPLLPRPVQLPLQSSLSQAGAPRGLGSDFLACDSKTGSSTGVRERRGFIRESLQLLITWPWKPGQKMRGWGPGQPGWEGLNTLMGGHITPKCQSSKMTPIYCPLPGSQRSF